MRPAPLLLTRASRVLVDLLMLGLAYLLAFLFRFEFQLETDTASLLLATLPFVVMLQYMALVIVGVPWIAWRYVGLRDMVPILAALASAGCILLVLRLAFVSLEEARFWVVPLGVQAMDAALAFLGIAGARVLRRLLHERSSRKQPAAARPRTRTLLVGAGRAGAHVAREILDKPQLGIEPLGFVDSDPSQTGSRIHGLRVLGPLEELPQICALTACEQVLIHLPEASGQTIRQIRNTCVELGVSAKIIPDLAELVSGQGLGELRAVAIEDLLRREPVEGNPEAVSAFVAGKRLLVTGAGGSIGAGLCSRLAQLDPARLILVERSESALFEVTTRLKGRLGNDVLRPWLLDVTDSSGVADLFDEECPQVVFHAAAHKHVPMLEDFPRAAIANNIFGTQLLAEHAARCGVEHFVLISSDKAVCPSSVMGATKRVAERMMQACTQRHATAFLSVRFGNVLGSSGSVVPLFRRQIAAGGPVTVTHAEMTRYFMTLSEATRLVLEAAAMGRGGEVFILDMGEPVRIIDLARDLIHLSGLRPGADIEIEICGPRPGEKLHEALFHSEEHAQRTRHPGILVGNGAPADHSQLWAELQRLEELLAQNAGAAELRAALAQLIPEYAPGSTELV